VPAVNYNIVLERGAKFEFTVRARNQDGTAMDLTGYSGKLQIRPTSSSDDVYLEATSANGRIAIDGATGTVAVTVGADITGPMTWQSGVYDLIVSDSASNVRRIAKGFAYLSPEVSR
jgi:hypothetical protein